VRAVATQFVIDGSVGRISIMASTTGAPLYVTVPDALTRPSRDPPPPFLQPAKTQLSAQSAAKQKKNLLNFIFILSKLVSIQERGARVYVNAQTRTPKIKRV
jgi:hypothetical protein